MLIGTYEHTVDDKGRLFIPAKLRSDLGEVFIGTKGVGECLFVFSMTEWERLSERLKTIPLANAAGQGFIRMLFANAFECIPDKQGRVLLPKTLRDRIHLEKDAVVNGVMSRVEIWPKAAWEDYCGTMDGDYDDMLSQLAELGI